MEHGECDESAARIGVRVVFEDEHVLCDEVVVAQLGGFRKASCATREAEESCGVAAFCLVIEAEPVPFAMCEEGAP
jgi:hypothetical protein